MWEIYWRLLTEKGLSTYKVCKDLGIPQGTIANWKKRGNMIGTDVGIKIANYLGVSLEYLMTGDEKRKYYLNDETAIAAQEAYTKQRILFDAAEGSRPEDIQMAVDLLNRLKQTNTEE